MRRIILSVVLLATCLSSVAFAQGLGSRLQTIGGWTLFRSTDPMTDEPSCVATFGDGSWVQLTETSFAVAYRGRGGVQGYRIRLNDDPPWDMRLPSRTEERIGAFVLEGRDYQRIIQASRVRVQALTVVGGAVNDDVDMSDAAAVLAVLNSAQCVGSAH